MNATQRHTKRFSEASSSRPEDVDVLLASSKVGQGQDTSAARIPQLDGIRGVAVLAVVLFHLVMFLPEGGPAVFRYGWVGVDLFFVLSGYLITGILLQEKGKAHYFRNFYVKRLFRIAPLYYAFLVVAWFPLARIFPVSDDRGSLLVYATYLQNIVYGFGSRELGPTWSLCVEEHFYLVWPALIALLSPAALRNLLLAVILSSPAFRLWGHAEGASWDTLYTMTPFRLDGLAMGGLIALGLPGWRPSAKVVRGVGVLAIAAWTVTSLCLSMAGDAGKQSVPVYSCLILASGALVLWCLIAPPANPLIRLLSWRPLRFLGTISYCVYLINQAVLQAAVTRSARSVWQRLGILDERFIGLMAVGAIIVVGQPFVVPV